MENSPAESPEKEKNNYFGGNEVRDYVANAILYCVYREVALACEEEEKSAALLEASASAQLESCLSDDVKEKLCLRRRSRENAKNSDESQVSMHRIEARLEKILKNIIKMTGCETQAEAVKTLSETLNHNQRCDKIIRKLVHKEKKCNRQFERYLVSSSVEEKRVFEEVESRQSAEELETEILAMRSVAMEKKAQLMELEITWETYNEDKSNALELISDHLDREIERAENECKNLSDTLAQYQVLGPEFHEIVKNYRQIKKEIRANEHVLYEIDDSEYPSSSQS